MNVNGYVISMDETFFKWEYFGRVEYAFFNISFENVFNCWPKKIANQRMGKIFVLRKTAELMLRRKKKFKTLSFVSQFDESHEEEKGKNNAGPLKYN